MANTKSALKEIRKTKRKTSINRFWKNNIKSVMRAFNDALSNKDTQENVTKALNKAKSTLDKASKRNIINKRKAARLKSKIDTKSKTI